MDNIRGKSNVETAELSQPLVVGAEPCKVPCASFTSTFGHGTQPSGLILLSDALWHRSQIFRVDPATVIVEGGQGTVLPIRINVLLIRINGDSMERFCSTNVGVKDNGIIGEGSTSHSHPINPGYQQHKTCNGYFHLADGVTVPW